jgi:hypothetical protein
MDYFIFLTEFIQAGGKTLRSEIHELTVCSVENREEVP